MEVADFPQFLVILDVCLYSLVDAQVGFLVPGLGGGLQSRKVGRLYVGAVSGEQAVAGPRGFSARSQACLGCQLLLASLLSSFRGEMSSFSAMRGPHVCI